MYKIQQSYNSVVSGKKWCPVIDAVLYLLHRSSLSRALKAIIIRLLKPWFRLLSVLGLGPPSLAVEKSRKAGIPLKTQKQTSWACKVWEDWVLGRRAMHRLDSQEVNNALLKDFVQMPVESMWVLVAEVCS